MLQEPVHKDQLRLPKLRKTQGQFSLSVVGSEFWNRLPIDVGLTRSRNRFRNLKCSDHGNIPLPSLELSNQVILGPIRVDPGLFAVPRLLDGILADKVLNVCCQLTHLQTRRLRSTDEI